MVFVDTGDGTAGVATVTDRSHAIVVTMRRDRDKKSFFTVVLFMVEFPFTGYLSHWE